MKSLYRKVDSFDGQTITINGKPSYELGSFLGGGAAGVVYEGADVSEASQIRPVAVKILNPVGFRLAPAATLRRCVVARRGQQVGVGPPPCAGGASAAGGGSGVPSEGGRCAPSTSLASPGAGMGVGRPGKLGPEHVWWLVSPNTKQVLAAYMDPRYGSLVELPLPKCIEIWGLNPRTDAPPSSSSSSSSCRSPNANAAFDHDCWSDDVAAGSFDAESTADGLSTGAPRLETYGSSSSGGGGECGGYAGGAFEVQVDGMGVSIPWLPPKYVQWLSQRRKVKREINNMGRVGGHRNVLELLSVLELLQDSKSTLFLILELVTGGELLDHIRLAGQEESRAGAGAGDLRVKTRAASALRSEGAAQRYFSQLLSGLAYCHRRGICHRDLSPSNLLLAESPQGDAPPELKVADFGLSACCGGFSAPGNENLDTRPNGSNERRGVPQRVRSVVGSPYYMAPEVASGSAKGYDGFKADAWSCGVVLYTMLTQSLPFDRELSRCPRFKRFKKWAENHSIGSSKKRPATTATTTTATTSAAAASASASASAATPHHRFPPHASSSPSPFSSSPSPSLSPTSSSSPPASSAGGVQPGAALPPAPVPPLWLFPPMIPPGARALLVSLLVPNPARRMSVEQALSHSWLASAGGCGCGTGTGVESPVGVGAGGGGAEGPTSTSMSMSGVSSTATATAPMSKDAGTGALIQKQPAFRQPSAAAAQEGARGDQQQRQQQQQRGDVSATVPPTQGGRRGSMPVRSPQGGRRDGDRNSGASGNGGAGTANDKASLLAKAWGRTAAEIANIRRDLIPSTTSFP